MQYDDLVRRAIESGDGLYEWIFGSGNIDKNGEIVYLRGYPVSRYHDAVSTYNYRLEGFYITVIFRHSVEELQKCPKYDLSGLPIDWKHVYAYEIRKGDSNGEIVCKVQK